MMEMYQRQTLTLIKSLSLFQNPPDQEETVRAEIKISISIYYHHNENKFCRYYSCNKNEKEAPYESKW